MVERRNKSAENWSCLAAIRGKWARSSIRFTGTSSPVLTLKDDVTGSMLVEFAMAVLVVVTLTLGIAELSMMIYTYNSIGNAARDGVRYAVVHGADSGSCSGPGTGCGDTTGANIVTVVKNSATSSLHDISQITVTPSWPDSSSQPGSRVRVQITYTYVPFINFPGFTPQMNLMSEARIVF